MPWLGRVFPSTAPGSSPRSRAGSTAKNNELGSVDSTALPAATRGHRPANPLSATRPQVSAPTASHARSALVHDQVSASTARTSRSRRTAPSGRASTSANSIPWKMGAATMVLPNDQWRVNTAMPAAAPVSAA